MLDGECDDGPGVPEDVDGGVMAHGGKHTVIDWKRMKKKHFVRLLSTCSYEYFPLPASSASKKMTKVPYRYGLGIHYFFKDPLILFFSAYFNYFIYFHELQSLPLRLTHIIAHISE